MKALLCLALIGCAEPPVVARPVVTELTHEVRVCLDKGGFRDGAEVRFHRSVCRPRVKTAGVDCHDVETGTGRVVRVLDAECAIVALSADDSFRASDGVELVPDR